MRTSSKKILVVGGAGYIGSHMVLHLQAKGFEPLVLDNLSTGHRHAVNHAELIIGDMGDTALLEKIFSSHSIRAVMHFASFIEVGESVRDPLKYYENNVANTIRLLRSLIQWNINTIIFSSSAAVYGEPHHTPINETHPLAPLSPYGHSKKMIEQILADLSLSHGLRYAVLRYFNAAGADPEGRAGEEHPQESHLIPLILQVAKKQRETMTIYGKDYPTEDGTCIRDYVHVSDLCEAHLLALHALWEGQSNKIYNLGTGIGHSVQRVIDGVQNITQQKIPITHGPRRFGDAAILVADPALAMRELDWKPKYPELDTIIKHSWDYCKRPRFL